MHKSVFKFTALFTLAFCLAGQDNALAQRTLLIPLSQSWQNAYRSGNYREALQIARQAQTLGTKDNLKKGELAVLLCDLGETLRAMGQYKEAEETFKSALKSCEEDPSKLGNRIALPDIYNDMPMLYEDEGRFAEAEGMWQQCELMTRKNFNFVFMPVNHLVRLYCLWGKLDKAAQYVEKAKICASRAPKTMAVPYAHYTTALYLDRKGQYKQSEEEYTEAMTTCAALYGKSHPYYARILLEESELFRQESRFSDAEQNLNQALKILQSTYNFDHPITAEAMIRLARVLGDEGKYNEAKTLAEKALKVDESIYGSADNLFVSKAKDCIGNILRQEGRYQDAQAMIEEALTSLTRLLGKDHIDVAVTMRDLAMVQEDQANYKEAQSLLRDSLTTINQQTGPDHPERAAAATALAHFYLRDAKYTEAEPLLKESLELSKKILGENNAVTAGSARDLGDLYSRLEQFDQAQNFLQQALAIDEKSYGAKSPQVAADCMTLASAYGSLGKSDLAEPLIKRAPDIKNVLPGGGVAADIEPLTPNKNTSMDRPVSDKWALVIGVSNFKDPSINLKYAAKDATDFKNFLIASEKFRADHVKLLTDENADRENIIGMLGDKWLGRHAHRDDLVVVYVSSHGSRSQDDAGGVNFLVAHDTNKNSLLATGIPMQWLTSIVKEQVHSDRVVLILDVCHSGSAAQGSKDLNRTGRGIDQKKLKIGEGQMIICSSSADQVSWESKNYENSVFTRMLVESLRTSKDKTTLLEAYKQLKILVEAEVLRDRGDLQTPVLWSKTWQGKDPVLAIDAKGNASQTK